MEIIYDQGSEFIGHEFRKYLIEIEYGIVARPSTFRKSHVQCNIGTYSPFSSIPGSDL